MFRQFRTLFPYLKRYRRSYLLGTLSLLLTSGAQLAIPQFIRSGVDALATGQAASTAGPALAIVGTAVLIALGRFGWRYWIQGASRRIETEMRQRFFEHLTTLSSTFFGRTKVGDLMALATNDLQHVRMASGMALIAFADGVFMTGAILAIMASQNLRVTLFAIIPLPLITLMILRLGRVVGHLFKLVQEGFADLSRQAQEVFSGIRVIKSFVKQTFFYERFEHANQTYRDRNMKLVKIWGMFFPIVTFLSGLTSLIVLRVGGEAVVAGEFSPGEFVATLSYLQMLIWPMLGAGFTVNMIQRGGAALARINAVMDEVPDIASPAVTVAAVRTTAAAAATGASRTAAADIEVRRLTYRYPGGETPALADVSFCLPFGGTLGILGRTGAGKSTLVKLLPRLIDPPPGTVFIGGRDIHDYHLEELRALFAFVAQDTFLFSASVRDNIAFGRDTLTDAECTEACEISTIARDLAEFPAGVATEIGERGVSLSGGQKQRIAISRAIAVDSPVLVFDDALSAVDTETEEHILSAVLTRRSGKSTILISHRVSTLAVTDSILVLDGGAIVDVGSHAELVAREGLYRNVYLLQQFERSDTA